MPRQWYDEKGIPHAGTKWELRLVSRVVGKKTVEFATLIQLLRHLSTNAVTYEETYQLEAKGEKRPPVLITEGSLRLKDGRR